MWVNVTSHCELLGLNHLTWPNSKKQQFMLRFPLHFLSCRPHLMYIWWHLRVTERPNSVWRTAPDYMAVKKKHATIGWPEGSSRSCRCIRSHSKTRISGSSCAAWGTVPWETTACENNLNLWDKQFNERFQGKCECTLRYEGTQCERERCLNGGRRHSAKGVVSAGRRVNSAIPSIGPLPLPVRSLRWQMRESDVLRARKRKTCRWKVWMFREMDRPFLQHADLFQRNPDRRSRRLLSLRRRLHWPILWHTAHLRERRNCYSGRAGTGWKQ